MLEHAAHERTAELRESEARFQSLTELACDWYWEQDELGAFNKVSGPVMEMLGIRVGTIADESAALEDDGWDMAERKQLQANIDERRPFLDLLLHRNTSDGIRLKYRVSGQPMFDHGARFIGYRGVGVEVTAGR